MVQSGLFVLLYDEKSLALYLSRGLFGSLMAPMLGDVPNRAHYPTLGDYACIRNGTHVFFFLKRRIVYGGQAIGADACGAFCLNGTYSPLGRHANADLYWDESARYNPTEHEGVFTLEDGKTRCQPYLIRFEDRLGIKGRWIRSDDLYWKLGEYGYPLPSNSIQGMSFCTLTPIEAAICVSLLTDNPSGTYPVETDEDVYLQGEPAAFCPELGVNSLSEAFGNDQFLSEAHIEASVIANPALLPEEARPSRDDTICRQVPISPFKPSQMDRADICYYSTDQIRSGSIPNVIIELKKNRAGKTAIKQVETYLDWMYRVAEDDASRITAYVLAPSFVRGANPTRYQNQIRILPLHNE